ncbi:hypothetical protein GSF70_15160 [Flavobacteriaceae bacterium W22]|nr:hypothetical protein [Flavobacteriaceae bacterium W22]
MVRIISILSFIMILATSNYCIYPQNKCGMTRKLLKFNLKIDNTIDTTIIYKYDGEFSRDEQDHLYYKKSNYKRFIKFYDNGKVGFFSFQNDIEKSDLDPCKAQNAYYGLDKKNRLVIKQFVVFKVNGNELYTYDTKFKNDTIYIVDRKLKERRYYKIYIKQKIPKDWLAYKPDW